MAKIEGREGLKRKFMALPGAVRKAITGSLNQGADELVSLERRLVPKDKGDLEASIHKEIEDAGGGDTFHIDVIAGGTEKTKREVRKGSGIFTDEAILKEFGTRGHLASGKFAGARIPAEPAQPFVRPAYRAVRKTIRARNTRAISQAIKSIASS